MKSAPEGQIVLADGRRLSWAEYGRTDGLPIFYCHGFPACRLEARLCDGAASAAGIRLIAADRPGFGFSTFQPGRILHNWPDDLAALANHLGLERFAVLGVSGGGPYALACAHRLRTRVSAVSVVGGLGQLTGNDLLRALRWPARCSFSLARRHPCLTRILYGNLVTPLLRRRPAAALALLTVAAPEADRRVLSADGVRSILTASIAGAFCRGGRGAVLELGILARSWGFDPREVALRVALWHGLADATVPSTHSQWLADALPDCRTTFLAAEGHFSLPVLHMDRILEDLIVPSSA